MTGGRRHALALATALWLTPSALPGQQVRGEVDIRVQSTEFERVASGPTVDLLRAAPVMATFDATAWGLGIEGLSLHLRTSLTDDLASDDVWPSTEPPVRLVEAYAEYARPGLTARAGRTPLHTRLGYESFDGAQVDVRFAGSLSATAFGGRSLARASSLPLTSPDASPLGEFRPARRGWLFGGVLRGVGGPVRGSLVYRREVDPAASKLSSEFVAASASIRLPAGFTMTGGADYDLGFGEWGNADATLAWAGPVAGKSANLAASLRRYRPRFELWSIWGAFSPVAYREAAVNAALMPLTGLRLRGLAARYSYGDPGTSSPVVSLEDTGWRWTAGAGWTGTTDWSFDVDFGAEHGPGAATTLVRLRAAWRPIDDLKAGGWISRGTMPLEFRIDDAVVRSAGVDLEIDLGRGLRIDGGVARFDERHTGSRPRAFDHWRLYAGLRYAFGSGADRSSLHPAILRIPERPRP